MLVADGRIAQFRLRCRGPDRMSGPEQEADALLLERVPFGSDR